MAALETGIFASGSEIQIQAPNNSPVPLLAPDVQYTALAHCQVKNGSTTVIGRLPISCGFVNTALGRKTKLSLAKYAALANL